MKTEQEIREKIKTLNNLVENNTLHPIEEFIIKGKIEILQWVLDEIEE